MSKLASSADVDTTIRPGLPFRGGNVSFRTIAIIPQRPGYWYVQQSNLGAGFFGTKPKIIEMSEERILELVSEEQGDIAAKCLTTVGPGKIRRSPRRKNGSERYSFRWGGSNQARNVASPC